MFNYIKRLEYSRSNKAFIKYLRAKGIKIGENCEFFGRLFIDIDLTRPSLISVGNNVVMTKGVTLLTHGYDWCVLRELYGTTLGSAKSIIIGNNVFIGQHVKILPGSSIGDNCIIGVGSVVTKHLEPNCVYAGNPAKFICTISDYFQKRKESQLKEAVCFAKSIMERFDRLPVMDDFTEFFELFLERENSKFGKIPVKHQTKNKFNDFMASKPLFTGFDEFLEYVLNSK
jgi:acetyltransferase-like isoleucine patch superfamily enzyme